MQQSMQKPIPRTRLRSVLGSGFFTLRRYFVWQFGGLRFAKLRATPCRYVWASHASPLMRRLKDVDMWMQTNKRKNLQIAIRRLDGMTLLPGETFSYWKAIGRPTRRKGYLPGMVLRNGSLTSGVGGGLCQLSNLIYWITIHTPLTVTERHRHGYDVFPDVNRTQPFGSGATCFYNYGDLMIRNDTSDVFRLRLSVTESDLTGRWCADIPPVCRYAVYEKTHRIQLEPWGGYTRHNILHRHKLALDDTVLDDEFVVENHAVMMYAPLLPQGQPNAEDTP